MKYKIKVSEKKKRLNFCLHEVNKNLQKFLLTFKQEEEYLDRLVMLKSYKDKNFVRTSVSFIHNRCVISLRARSVFRLFKLSRHQIKQFGAYGRITGLSKFAR